MSIKNKVCKVASVSMVLIGVLSAEVVQLTPEKVVELAKKQNINVKTSEINILSQQKTVQGTLASFLPSISSTGSLTHIEKPSTGTTAGAGADDPMGAILKGISSMMATPDNLISAGISINQPIFTGGKLSNGLKLAKTTTKIEQAKYERALTDIGFTAEQMYWGYVVMLKGLESFKESRIWLEDIASMQEKLFKNQMIIELDLLNTQIQIGNLKLAELKTKNAITNFGDQMLQFIGLSSGTLIEVDTSALEKDFDQFSPPNNVEIEKMLDERQDLKALKYSIESLKIAKKIQMGAYLPNVVGYVNTNFSNQYSAADEKDLKRTTTAGLQLSWTIFDWGKNARDAQKTDLQIQSLELNYKFVREQIRLKINSLVRAVDESRSALEIAHQDMEIAKKALEIAKIKYNAQSITNNDLLDSRRMLTEKVVAYTQARVNAIMALEEYKIAPLALQASQAK